MKNEMPKDIWACRMSGTNEPFWFDGKSCDDSTTQYILKSHSDAEIAKISENYSYVWRWVERAIWCKDLRESAISCLKHTPYAPWNDEKVEWDTAHKEYDDDIKATQSEIAKRDECIKELVGALDHAVRIAEAEQYGNWDDLLPYRKLLAKHKQTIEGIK